jgi:hypothetical protein
MSPTEHDLRAALSDGEGDGPDPDRLIELGQARQARRRMQVLTTAAVVVIAAAGTGIVALGRTGGGNTDSAVRGATSVDLGPTRGTGAAGGAATGARPAASGYAAKAASAAVGCPATLPRYALPGGGSPGQFGAGDPLFSKPVRSVIVCSYPDADTAASAPVRRALQGAQATGLAASLDAAPRSPGSSCAARAQSPARNLAIIGLAADGTQLGTVTVTRTGTSCAASQVTNGTAVRYNWTPPSDLLPILAGRTPTMHGSPVSS